MTVRTGSWGIGLAIGAAAVAGAAAWLHDPVDTPEHRVRECRLVAALEQARMAAEAERARDTPLPYWVYRAEGVSGRPRAFKPKAWVLRPMDHVLAFLGRKAVAPIDCGSALDAARVPARVIFSPDKPGTISRLIYSRAVFWPGDRYALISRTPCDLYSRGWNQKTYPLLLRREGEVWTPIEVKDELLVFTIRPYGRRAMPCFAN